MANWLNYTSSDYDANVDKWKYVADHLEGAVIDDRKIGTYLHKRRQGESDDAYVERRRIVDYTPHFHRAALTLAGMLWAVEYDARRSWSNEEGGEGLGSPQESGSIMSRLWQNADGKGTNWRTLWRSATTDVICFERLYVLVDGVRRNEDGETIAEPSVKIIPPQAVLRVIRDETGRMVSAKVKTSVETSMSQEEKPEEEERYLIFNLDGVQTWREVKGKPEMIDSRPYGAGFQYLDTEFRPTLPLVEIKLPLRGNLGYIMAKKANALFNQTSSADFQMWTSGFAKLFADVKGKDGEFDADLWKAIKEALIQGSTVIPGSGNRFGAAPTESLTAKQKILAQKVKEFFTTFFQAYGDAASERTATEIRQDFRAGVEAFLTLLAATMDEAENAAFWLLEQVYFPDSRDVWGGAFVERSTNFQPVDIEARLRELVARYMPNGRVPVDAETLLEIAVKVLESDGIAVNQEKKARLLEEIESERESAAQRGNLLSDFGIAA